MKRFGTILAALLLSVLCTGAAAMDPAAGAAGALTFGPEVARADIAALTPAQRAVLAREAIGPVVALCTVEGEDAARERIRLGEEGLLPAEGGSITLAIAEDAEYTALTRFRVIAMASWSERTAEASGGCIGLSWDPFFTLEGGTHEAYTYYNKNGTAGFSDTDGSDHEEKCRLAGVDGSGGLSYGVQLTPYDRMVVLAATVCESSESGREGTSLFWTACAYMHTQIDLKIESVTFSVSASPGFDVTRDRVRETPLSRNSASLSKEYES